MLAKDVSTLKNALITEIDAKLTREIEELRTSLGQIQLAANEETKSSAGDKYETGRAMAHLEIEKLQHQIADKEAARHQLHRLLPLRNSTVVIAGSIVKTTQRTFFLSVNAGEFTLEGEAITTISTASPVARALLGKSEGEEYRINAVAHRIIRIH